MFAQISCDICRMLQMFHVLHTVVVKAHFLSNKEAAAPGAVAQYVSHLLTYLFCMAFI